MSKKLVNIQQVMELFDVDARSTIYRWLQQGKIPPPVKRWGSPMWDIEELEAVLKTKDLSQSVAKCSNL